MSDHLEKAQAVLAQSGQHDFDDPEGNGMDLFALAHAATEIAVQLTALVEQQRLQLLVTICATSAVTLSDQEYAAIQARIRKGLGLPEEVFGGA